MHGYPIPKPSIVSNQYPSVVSHRIKNYADLILQITWSKLMNNPQTHDCEDFIVVIHLKYIMVASDRLESNKLTQAHSLFFMCFR